MASILFVTWDGGGNVPPALGIAGELRRRGHEVAVLGQPQQSTAVEAAGVEFVPTRQAMPFTSLDDNSVPTLVRMFGDRALGRDTLEAVATRAADIVVVDAMLFGAMDALRRAGTPYVVLEHLYDAYFRKGWMRGPIGLGMRLLRLRPSAALAGARTTLVASLPDLDPGAAAPAPGLHWTGPVLPPVQPRTATDPTILISLSTYHYRRMTDSLQRLVDAAAGLDARVVVTTGPVVDPAKLRVPSGVEVHRYVPHAELMPRATLMVGHGGHSTTMQALAHDLPMVVMPMHPLLDQPLVGRTVERAGAGRVVAKKAGVEELRPVLAELLEDGPHRAAAARLGAAIRALPGAPVAADAVEAQIADEVEDGVATG